MTFNAVVLIIALNLVCLPLVIGMVVLVVKSNKTSAEELNIFILSAACSVFMTACLALSIPFGYWPPIVAFVVALILYALTAIISFINYKKLK